MRQAIGRILQIAGQTPVLFASAESLLESVANAEQAVCLVVDVRLPGMNGLELLQNLYARGIRCPVVVITAHDEPELCDAMRHLGILKLLSKPFHGRELIEIVNVAVESNRDRERAEQA